MEVHGIAANLTKRQTTQTMDRMDLKFWKFGPERQIFTVKTTKDSKLLVMKAFSDTT